MHAKNGPMGQRTNQNDFDLIAFTIEPLLEKDIKLII